MKPCRTSRHPSAEACLDQCNRLLSWGCNTFHTIRDPSAISVTDAHPDGITKRYPQKFLKGLTVRWPGVTLMHGNQG
jgi:hypothetical protein